jgi:hypothetical protein
MITAVDTNIILDVLIPGEPFGESSKELLERLKSEMKIDDLLSSIPLGEDSTRQFKANVKNIDAPDLGDGIF